MTTYLSCVYCPDDVIFRPGNIERVYILDGCSVCESCLRKIQTEYETNGEGYRPLGSNRSLNEILEPYSSDKYDNKGMIMQLLDSDGKCLASAKVEHPVVNGDMISFPPLVISLD
jgi:hypothetical protein